MQRSPFQEYDLSCYQCYADILPAQGKKMGSHTNGNLNNLGVEGLDVLQSATVRPLTRKALKTNG